MFQYHENYCNNRWISQLNCRVWSKTSRWIWREFWPCWGLLPRSLGSCLWCGVVIAWCRSGVHQFRVQVRYKIEMSIVSIPSNTYIKLHEIAGFRHIKADSLNIICFQNCEWNIWSLRHMKTQLIFMMFSKMLALF